MLGSPVLVHVAFSQKEKREAKEKAVREKNSEDNG